MIIVNTPEIPNKKIKEVHGIARGSTVRARNVGRDIFASLKNIVGGVKDAVNEDGSVDAQGLDYGRMTPVLTAAIKELIAKVETLEARIAVLEG